jgi:hypothetical protein
MRAFYERIRARRRHNVAVVAVARKLTVLFWRMLTREEQYAHQQPSLMLSAVEFGHERGCLCCSSW